MAKMASRLSPPSANNVSEQSLILLFPCLDSKVVQAKIGRPICQVSGLLVEVLRHDGRL